MAVVAGIDEAGFGPKLGPLVVSAVTLRVPDERKDDCIWKILRSSCSRKVRKNARRLVVADSKQLYHNREDLHRAYDESGEMLMHLQSTIDYEHFARALSIGPETMVMDFRPEQPMHNRYAVSHDFLSASAGWQTVAISRVVNALEITVLAALSPAPRKEPAAPAKSCRSPEASS